MKLRVQIDTELTEAEYAGLDEIATRLLGGRCSRTLPVVDKLIRRGAFYRASPDSGPPEAAYKLTEYGRALYEGAKERRSTAQDRSESKVRP